MLTFSGTNLGVVQDPMLVIADPQYLIEANVSAMTVLSTINIIFSWFCRAQDVLSSIPHQ